MGRNDEPSHTRNITEHKLQGMLPRRPAEHLNVSGTLFRQPGSEDEWKAARHIVDAMKNFGIEAEILETVISCLLKARQNSRLLIKMGRRPRISRSVHAVRKHSPGGIKLI